MCEKLATENNLLKNELNEFEKRSQEIESAPKEIEQSKVPVLPPIKQEAPKPLVVPIPLSVPIAILEQNSNLSNIRLFKECILEPKGKFYEDESLQIMMARTISKETKSSTFQLTFINKRKDSPIEITKFGPALYDKMGIYIIKTTS